MLETFGYDFQKDPQKVPKEGLKAGQHTALAVSIDGPNDGLLVNQRPVGDDSSIGTYLRQVSTQKLAQYQYTEAKGWPVG